MSSPQVFCGVQVTRSLVLCVCFVDRCLSFCTFFWPLCCSFSLEGFWLPLWYLQTLLSCLFRSFGFLDFWISPFPPYPSPNILKYLTFQSVLLCKEGNKYIWSKLSAIETMIEGTYSTFKEDMDTLDPKLIETLIE